MQAKDIMTRDVVTVGPTTSVKDAAALMVQHGFAAIPVVDHDHRLIGIVAEADVLRDRLPQDPRLHLRRDSAEAMPPPLAVQGVMTTRVRSVEATADVADVASIILEGRFRSLPVMEDERLVGIISRRDLLRSIIRTDADICADLERLVDIVTGEHGSWKVSVREGVATLQRTGALQPGPHEREEGSLRALARTVRGVVGILVLPADQE